MVGFCVPELVVKGLGESGVGPGLSIEVSEGVINDLLTARTRLFVYLSTYLVDLDSSFGGRTSVQTGSVPSNTR